MGLITTKELLRDAQASHYAVPAFNVENMECIQGVVWAAKEMNVPVIIQTTPSSVRYAGVEFFCGRGGGYFEGNRSDGSTAFGPRLIL